MIEMFSEIDIKYQMKDYTQANEGFEFDFLNERPPNSTEVTDKVIEIISKA